MQFFITVSSLLFFDELRRVASDYACAVMYIYVGIVGWICRMKIIPFPSFIPTLVSLLFQAMVIHCSIVGFYDKLELSFLTAQIT